MKHRRASLRSSLFVCILAVSCVVGVVPAGATTLTFDELPVGSMTGLYGGLSWQFWQVVVPAGGTNQTATHDGFGESGVTHPVEIAPGSCCVAAPFDFLGADFARGLFGQDPLHEAGSMLLRGWLAGAEIYTVLADLAETGFTHVAVNFTGIDALSVQPIRANTNGIGYPGFFMDNFAFRLSEEVQVTATATAPEPATLLLVGTGAALVGRRRYPSLSARVAGIARTEGR